MKGLIPALAAALAAAPALAADPLYEQGFSMRLGGFRSTADTTLRVDAANGALGYLRLARDARKTIAGEIRFGDQVFPVSTNVNSAFDSDVWRLTYGWSFYREGGNELSLLLGLHTTKFNVKLESSGGGIAEAAERTIPLPTIGLQGSWALGQSWRLNALAQFFSLDYDDYEGSLVSASVAAEYRMNPNLAAGVGYILNDYDLDVTKGKARGSFDYQFSGPMIYVTAGF